MAPPTRRPFRFTVQASHLGHPDELRPLARRAEDLGAAALTVADHLDDQLAPLAALMAAADATTTLRIGSMVFANDYRPVAAARIESTGVGLSNLAQRFTLATGRSVICGRRGDRYEVRLPLAG